jgi:hypothetical protein
VIGEERVTIATFMATRAEERGQLRSTLFPPEVRIRVLDDPHAWAQGEAGTLYVTFSPSYTTEGVQYKITADDLERCTRMIAPAAVG